MNQGFSCGGGDRRLDFSFILKVKLTVFADRLDVRCERRRGVKDDSKVFGMSNQKDGGVPTENCNLWKEQFGEILYLLSTICALHITCTFKYLVNNWVYKFEVQRSALGCLYKFGSHQCAVVNFKVIRLDVISKGVNVDGEENNQVCDLNLLLCLEIGEVRRDGQRVLRRNAD